MDELVKCGTHLMGVCEPVASQAVERTLKDVRERCDNLMSTLLENLVL